MVSNNIIIFGASGQIGRKASAKAIEKGFNVRVFLRDPSQFPEELHTKVEVIVGDVTKQEDVQHAIKGQTAVIVTLGTRNDLGPTTVLSRGMENIIKAMKFHGVDIVSVCISAFLFYQPEKVPAVFQSVTADHQRMYDCLKESGLKWIAVFPPHFTDDSNPKYVVQHGELPGRSISKVALGAFMVDSLEEPENYQKVCGVAQADN